MVSHRGLIKLLWIIYTIFIKVSYMFSGIILYIYINWIISNLYLQDLLKLSYYTVI